MTQPLPGGPLDEQAIIAFELGAEAELALLVGGPLAALFAALTALAVLAEASPEGELSEDGQDRARAAAVRVLHELADDPPSLAERLRAIVVTGLALGVAAAAGRQVSRKTDIRRIPDVLGRGPAKDPILIKAIGQADKAVANALAAAEHVARTSPMRTGTELRSVVAAGQRAVNRARAAARYAANYSVNAGVAAEARRAGAGLLWVAERDGCLHCLRYSGEVAKAGRSFPEGLSFADKPLELPATLKHPPLHPNCRCRVRVWSQRPAAARAASQPDALAPDALKREAKRSVARGMSGYASNGARLKAADRLVSGGVALPRTVVARARADIRAGQFSGRHRVLMPALPGGTPGRGLRPAERARLERIRRMGARRVVP